ncbi:MAG: bifunctional UDP-N-acetylglucosamine diphosphorylase/glucosamine-1-phosphate N-acetyltransferase GlmU [Thermoleophilaceae bacterium]
MSERLTVLVMAAGRGTRMRSSLPKVLHPVCGKPMVEWVIDAALEAGADEVVCITRPGDGVAEGLPDNVVVAEQDEGEGTGAAVLAAREAVGDRGEVVVLSGDVPLQSAELIAALVATHREQQAAATLLTTEDLDPAGYGRVVRAADGSVERIVETKHVDRVPAEELAIREINIGTYAFAASELWTALDHVGLEHGERYLPGALPVLRERGLPVVAHVTGDVRSAMGVNDRAGLMKVEELAQRQIIEGHARAGVTFEGPASTRVETEVTIGEDTVIAAATTLRGRTEIGSGCHIGPSTTVTDSVLGDGIGAPHCFLVQAHVEDGASLGPFAYLRPGAHIGPGAKVGTFVEVKNSEIGAGAKVPHLSYIGDADIGEQSNIGAGNITANYDGRHKHRTTIGAGVRTGVDTAFVAPVSIGDGAYTGAGSIITEDVPDGALGMARATQKNIEGYAKRKERG